MRNTVNQHTGGSVERISSGPARSLTRGFGDHIAGGLDLCMRNLLSIIYALGIRPQRPNRSKPLREGLSVRPPSSFDQGCFGPTLCDWTRPLVRTQPWSVSGLCSIVLHFNWTRINVHGLSRIQRLSPSLDLSLCGVVGGMSDSSSIPPCTLVGTRSSGRHGR